MAAHRACTTGAVVLQARLYYILVRAAAERSSRCQHHMYTTDERLPIGSVALVSPRCTVDDPLQSRPRSAAGRLPANSQRCGVRAQARERLVASPVGPTPTSTVAPVPPSTGCREAHGIMSPGAGGREAPSVVAYLASAFYTKRDVQEDRAYRKQARALVYVAVGWLPIRSSSDVSSQCTAMPQLPGHTAHAQGFIRKSFGERNRD